MAKNAIEAIKESLKTSNNITQSKIDSTYTVWDDYGMNFKSGISTLKEAVDILFMHLYAI